MIETFEKWYNSLTDAQQKELLDHIFNKKIKSLNEGLFVGPIGKLEKGLFTGPISSQRICPTCGRTM
ncbi:MAG TPA: hypothetical protein PLG11_07545 [Bacteroidales bacterium]|jgi:hypothetical protein|nr:hypothetical protein [Bacteroidales bacterium]HOC16050.1 hypothetical protein [Bacteroidales bacterium]HPN49461.1 hypothetical protein [Bacteroidales bacterium]HQB25767.1 hypothetical protein [Bacteroidales bacterium]HQL07443.1 hypothetical protein [Bacteroidales bacterium]